jgi:hypothetical protein
VPWLLAILFVLPQLFSDNITVMALNMSPNSNFVPIFSSILVVGGLFGAVSINVLNQVFSLCSNTQFADYLKEEKIFDIYIFWPQYALSIQILLMFSCLASIFAYYTAGIGVVFIRISLFNISMLFYTFIKTWDLIDMVRVLAWHRQEYLSLLEAEKNK